MTKYLQPKFSVGGSSKVYEDHYEEVFGSAGRTRWCSCGHSKAMHEGHTVAKNVEPRAFCAACDCFEFEDELVE